MSDIGEGRFLPELMAALRDRAPSVRLETRPVPREQIGAFVSCVVREMRSKSLHEAVGDCARDLPGE